MIRDGIIDGTISPRRADRRMGAGFAVYMVVFAIGCGPELINASGTKAGKSTEIEDVSDRVAGNVELTLEATSIWSVPSIDSLKKNDVNAIHLRFVNRCSAAKRIRLLDTISFELIDAKGAIRKASGGRNVTRPGQSVSPAIAPNASFDVKRDAWLQWQKNGQLLQFVCEDGFGGIWSFAPIEMGTYKLIAKYANRPAPGKEAPDVWIGNATASAVTIQIQDASK